MPPPTPETDCEDEEPFPTADVDDPVWDEEPVSDSRVYLCIHEIPRLATPTPPLQPVPEILPPQPTQGVPTMPPQ